MAREYKICEIFRSSCIWQEIIKCVGLVNICKSDINVDQILESIFMMNRINLQVPYISDHFYINTHQVDPVTKLSNVIPCDCAILNSQVS